MLLGLILSILTATYTLSSNNTVVLEGDIPAYSTATFERTSTTGKKGQMTKGNATYLQLEGWDGCTIRKVVLEMHSNSKTGSGTLVMKVGKKVVWEIEKQSFSDKGWAGDYTTDWVGISTDMMAIVGDNEKVDIRITASENSLYINSYRIEYEPAEPTCHSVSFNTGLDIAPQALVQSEIGAPVVLPEWKDTAAWYFVGWSETEIVEVGEMSCWLQPGSEYVPRRNTTLWAVYSDVDEISAVTDFESGQYVLTMWNPVTEFYSTSGMAMTDNVEDNEITLCNMNMYRNQAGRYCLASAIEENMIYQLDFLENGKLGLTHVQSGKRIGYGGNDNRLINGEEELWDYKVLEDSSLLLYFTNKQTSCTYVLSCAVSNSVDNKRPVLLTQNINVDKWTKDAFWLFPVVYPRYTSCPFEKVIEEEDKQQENFQDVINEGVFVMNIANYCLYVKEKKKYLIPLQLVY